jgi:hypothetical protein
MTSRSSRVGPHMLVTCRVNVPGSLHLPRSTCRVPPAGSTRGVGSTCGPHVPCGSTYRLDIAAAAASTRVFVSPAVPTAVLSISRVDVPCWFHLPRRRAVLVPLAASTFGVGSTCGPNVRVGSTCRLDRPCRFHLRPTSEFGPLIASTSGLRSGTRCCVGRTTNQGRGFPARWRCARVLISCGVREAGAIPAWSSPL